ncbi:MAG TPA: thiamine pyrophosphate-dependent enzyme [Bryobacteraceae bacterium]|nr:thiamine pyrophosphate-dependent enzyme [Bryobacteraceae bacterium]
MSGTTCASVLFSRDTYGKPLISKEPHSVYAFGLLVRKAEQLLLKLFSQGLLSGTTHTCIGQEICAISVVRALNEPGDAVFSNHRNHGHFLTYSGNFLELIAEVMGREAGVCRGVGGSQHIAYRHFHSNGVQAGMTGIAAGHALAMKKRGENSIVAAMVGDGTLGEGLLYESMNLASIWCAPLLFVIENNGVAQTTSTAETIGGSIEARGAAFGLQTWHLDDAAADFLDRIEDVVADVRATKKPGFLVIDTRRMGPHSKGDDLRTESEMAEIIARDPLTAYGLLLSEMERQEIDQFTTEFIESVHRDALASPESTFVDVPACIFGADCGNSGSGASSRHSDAGAPQNVRGSLNSALRDLLSSDDRVLLLGEDLHDPYGGAFKVTAGLSTEFPGRVISTPISEAGVTGAGIGLAMSGYRPIVEIMFADFATLAMDQLFNHAVKFPGMFPDTNVPIVIRTPSGGRRGYGPTHSQSIENLLTSVPGLTVVFASERHNPGQVLWNAVLDWPYPTLCLEHKLLYGKSVGSGTYEALPPDPTDLAAHLFPTLVNRQVDDPDVTIVCYGHCVGIAEEAAARLSEEEIDVEIVVPSLLAPLPAATLTRALMNRARVITFEESPVEYGFAAELGSKLLQAGFKGRFTRLGSPAYPIPAARSLEASILPGTDAVVDTVTQLLLADILRQTQ